MEDQTYEQQLKKDLDDAHKRVVAGIAASNFLKTPEGKLIQDWVNERVSYLMDKMTSKTPMDARDYLAAHGGIRELKDFNVMLQSKAMAGKSAEAEVEALNGQQQAITNSGQ